MTLVMFYLLDQSNVNIYFIISKNKISYVLFHLYNIIYKKNFLYFIISLLYLFEISKFH